MAAKLKVTVKVDTEVDMEEASKVMDTISQAATEAAPIILKDTANKVDMAVVDTTRADMAVTMPAPMAMDTAETKDMAAVMEVDAVAAEGAAAVVAVMEVVKPARSKICHWTL